MDIKNFREIIDRREYIEQASRGEWSEGIEECWKREIEILSADVSGTVDFLNSECTASEFSWISEIIEELISRTQSSELLESFKKLKQKYPEEFELYNIAGSIQFAAEALNGVSAQSLMQEEQIEAIPAQ